MLVSQGEVDAGDIVGIGMGSYPLEGLFQVGKVARAIVREYFEGDEIGSGGNAGIVTVAGGEDTGNMRAVPVDI